MSAETKPDVEPWVDDPDEDPADLEVGDEPPPVAGGSVLDALRARREAAGADRTFDVEVPGWDALLVLRLGAVTPAQQTAIAKRLAASGNEQIPQSNLDTLIAAYRCALGRA